MKKKRASKKITENSFIQGAFVATFGIVVSKILGIVYVIPFYAIIGAQGGALYGYAYNIYSLFLSISQAGLPLAMSKIISEYQTLGYYKAKRRAYSLGKKILNLLGLVSFLILFIFARSIASMIIGNVTGGNTIEDVTTVIRVVATAVLVVPILSVSRGYLQGHKFITPTSMSQIIEQVVRVVFIIGGSFISLKVLKLDLTTGVGIALFAATLGALASYLYLVDVIHKNKDQLNKEVVIADEPKISDKKIIRKLLMYALPFVMIDIVNTLYNSVDIMTLVKQLVNNFNYTAAYAESIMSVISTWGSKLNMIVASVNTGILVSLIPHLTASLTKKDNQEISRRVNQSLQIIIFLVIPMVVGLSLLAKPVWTTFYGYKSAIEYGAVAYQFYVFIALGAALYTTSITMVQVLKEYKMVLFLIIFGLVIKIMFNYPLLYAFNEIGLPAYYGAFTATILGDIIPAFIAFVFLNKKFKISYEETFQRFIDVLIATLVMAIVIIGLSNIVSLDNPSRIISLLNIVLYTIVGATVYLIINYKNKVIQDIFGQKMIDKVKNKVLRKKG